MTAARLIPGQHVHLVGIGGAGLSAIARVLLRQGYFVSGSDRSASAVTEALAREGALVYIGHDAQQVMGAELVIVSSAVADDHVEAAMARALDIPVYRRADIVGALTAGQQVIAVAGTHGKTTTSAMIAHVLLEAGHDPSYIVGGLLRSTGSNAGVGRGRAFVIEADEYDNMYHGLRPQTAVVTSVEFDHPDFFATPGDMVRSFAHFASLLPADGLLVACADDPAALVLAQNRLVSGLPVTTYGLDSPLAAWRGARVRVEGEHTLADVTHDGQARGALRLRVPGAHNVCNALAALAAADRHGVAFDRAAAALGTFEGAGRRFELRADVGGVAVIDDYAHHPTAIRVTLEAARQRYPERAVWAVWQPHTYSRTRALLDGYAAAFGAADHVVVTDIYAAREQPIPGVTGAAAAAALAGADVRHAPGLADAARLLAAEVRAPAVIVIMSAGDAPEIGRAFLQVWRAQTGQSDDRPAPTAG